MKEVIDTYFIIFAQQKSQWPILPRKKELIEHTIYSAHVVTMETAINI